MARLTDQVRSRQRVADHGEVLTNEREVNAMLDLVKQETERIESRFLEPACGDGNFLAEVLRRKLAVVRRRYGKSQREYERYAFVAVSSIYGVELLADNAQACRDRLLGILVEDYLGICKGKPNQDYLASIRFLLERNILQGNALSLKKVDDETNDLQEPIIFSEWSLVTGNKVKRRDYRLDELIGGSRRDEPMTLFGMHDNETFDWEFDEETDSYIPEPLKEFPLTSLFRISETPGR